MFKDVKKSAISTTKNIDTEKLKAQASQVGATISEGAHHAKEWTTPRVEAFIEWVTPRLEQAWNETVRHTAPRVSQAAQKAAPVIDRGSEKLVEDYIPRFVSALQEAAEKATEVTAKGLESVGEKTREIAVSAPQKISKSAKKASKKAAKKAAKAEKNSHKGLWFLIITGVAAGLYALWRKSQPVSDPWDSPWPVNETEERSEAIAKDIKEEAAEVGLVTEEKVSDVKDTATEVVNDVKEEVAEKAAEVKEDLKDAPKPAPRRRTRTVKPEENKED